VLLSVIWIMILPNSTGGDRIELGTGRTDRDRLFFDRSGPSETTIPPAQNLSLDITAFSVYP